MSIMPPRKRRSYTAEYKVEAAHRVIDSDRTIAEVPASWESTRGC
jgi:transposase-like protein